jgi:MinD-like ATPase involved in chromosome partitioning or flagellar assembly
MIAAIWGSPGSGKTITAVKIAKALADKKKNVIIVGCDIAVPLLPVLLPSENEVSSLGEVLSLPTLSDISVLQHCVPFKNKYISILGYRLGDNIQTYPDYSFSPQRAKEFISILKHTADYVIIDCTSNHINNKLTAAALEQADITFKVVNADLKSISFLESQSPLLQGANFKYNQQINIISDVLPSQDITPLTEYLGKSPYILPHVSSLKEQYDCGGLLDTVFGKSAKDYVMAINLIVKEVFKDNEAS